MWTVPATTQTAAELIESALTLTVLVHAGAVYMRLWVVDAALGRRRIRAVIVASGILAVGLSGLLVVVTGLRLAAAPLRDVLHPSVWGSALWWEPVAVAVAVTASVPLTVSAEAFRARGRMPASSAARLPISLRITATATATVTAAAPSLMGHSQATQPVWLGTLVDAAHLTLGAFWLGGVLCLVLLFAPRNTRHDRRRPNRERPSDDDRRDSSVHDAQNRDSRAGHEAEHLLDTVSRFSQIALITVIALILTGTGSAVLILDSPAALVESDYGRILIVKVTLVACAGAVALWNRIVLLPDLRRRRAVVDADGRSATGLPPGRASAADRATAADRASSTDHASGPRTIALLARSLTTEALILISIAVVTGILTQQDPHMHPMG